MNTIHIPHQYEGQAGFYSYDIAVVVLSSYIKINNMVLPACIDWNNEFTVRDGNIGKVINSHICLIKYKLL